MKQNIDAGRQPAHAISDRRLPWWMYVVGLSYIVTFGLIFYLIFWGPAELTGFVNAFSDGAMLIRSVDDPNSPVAKGGLRTGDRVLAIDDRPMRAVRDWTEATGNSQAGRPQLWVVSRGSDRLTTGSDGSGLPPSTGAFSVTDITLSKCCATSSERSGPRGISN
jgi:hypothetical protein